jgi:hypothetical protein
MRTTSFAFAALTIALIALPAQAVLIVGPDGTTNTTTPAASGIDMPYWDSIGQIPDLAGGSQNYSAGGTGVYLGGGYVLTAYHIRAIDNPSVINFGGTEYTIDTNSWQRLSNSDDNTDADLALFRISGALPNVTPVPYDNIPSSISNNQQIYMMGFGRDRNGGQTTYYISPDGGDSDSFDDLYTSLQGDTDYSLGGFDLLTSKSLRWGTNNVEGTLRLDDGHGLTDSMQIIFDAMADDNQAQLTNGDSGGPAFIFDTNDDTWKLVGLNIAMGPSYSNQGIYRQPYTHAPSGPGTDYNFGFIADLTQYQSQLVPEPATFSLLSIGGLALLVRRRRRSR